jgi:hypothetical protein
VGRDSPRGVVIVDEAELTRPLPGMLGAVVGRAESQVLRISMILALSDGSSKIRVEHLKSSLGTLGLLPPLGSQLLR